MTSRERRPDRDIFRIAVALAFAAVAIAVARPVAGGRAPDDRRPDLRMAPPRDLRVCGSPTGGTFQQEDCPPPAPGDQWLRFGSLLMNVGDGPLELIATRASTDVDQMTAVQRVRRAGGRSRTVPTGATLHWAEEEDGHPHWHTEGVERYRLFRLPEPFDDGEQVGVKRGYCVFDGRIVRPDLPGVRSRQAYPFESCGTLGSSEDLLTVRTGLSVGWGDEYAWDYAGQRVPIPGVAEGDYLLCLTADPLGQFRERREGNNEAWSRIRLSTSVDQTAFGVDVTVLGRGSGPCQDEVPYRIPSLLRPRATERPAHRGRGPACAFSCRRASPERQGRRSGA